MKAITTLSALLLSFIIYAQKAPIKFGDIPKADLVMTTYPEDESAPAVILEDYGEAYVSITASNASLIVKRHVRIKILKKEGLKWADIAIQLYHSGAAHEKVSNLKAVTYNLENGKITEHKLSKDGIFRERFNRNFNVEKFTMPNVKEGSVLEYSYTIYSDFIANFPNWQFQYTIPVRLSEYWAIIPDFFVMEKYMQGYIASTGYEVKSNPRDGYRENAHHWLIKNVPAFKNEPYMTSERDYISKINFALAYIDFPGQPTREIMGTWAKLNTDLIESESFGKIISGSGYLKKKVEELLSGEEDAYKKLEVIYQYVKDNVEWDGENDYLGDKPRDVLEKKRGTTGDVNLALASMLEKAGIPVEMLLLSTRDHGFVRQQYPMSRQFNYTVCIATVNGAQVYLDATDKYLPIGVLPERCLNGEGLKISESGHSWVDLESEVKDKTIIVANLVLDKTNDIKGEMTFTHEGYDAFESRRNFNSKGESTYLKNLGEKHSNWRIEKTTFEYLSDLDLPLNEKHVFTISDHVTDAGEILYINPIVTEQLDQNPFKLESRFYPVDFGSKKEKLYIAKLEIPEDYVVDDLPKSGIVSMPEGAAKFVYNVSTMGNIISISSHILINKSIYSQSEYPYLREFYNMVVAKHAEQVVLKKNQ